jgi:hypothetical protein
MACKAEAALEEHKRKFLQYAFRSLQTKGRSPESANSGSRAQMTPTGARRSRSSSWRARRAVSSIPLSRNSTVHTSRKIITRFEKPLTSSPILCPDFT